MLSHSDLWSAIDAIAARHGLSPSGLARRAGLDATAFNRSKRISKDGRERWPSTESIAKVLHATNESFDVFFARGTPPPVPAVVPLLGLGEARSGGLFDAGGFPKAWDVVSLPWVADDRSFALEVSGTSMLPLYREGDIIVVSPAAPIRRGDRVVVRTREGEVLIKVLYQQTAKLLELHALNPLDPPRVIDMQHVEGMGRIVWVSQ